MHFKIQRFSESRPDVEAFLDTEWSAWHGSEGHDPTEDWSSLPVVIVARADRGDQIIGVAVGRTSAGVGHLSELMVTRRTRGLGIGTELMHHFETHCWSADCHKITVHTDLDGPAHRFYEGREWRQEAVFRRDRGGRDFVRLCKFKTEEPGTG